MNWRAALVIGFVGIGVWVVTSVLAADGDGGDGDDPQRSDTAAVVKPAGVEAGGPAAPATDGEVVHEPILQMSPAQFDQWVGQFNGNDAHRAADALVARLKAGLYVPDDTLQTIVRAQRSIDSSQAIANPQLPEAQRDIRSLALIKQIQDAIYKRPMIQAWLHAEAGELYEHRVQYEHVVRERAAAREIWHQVHLDVDIDIVRNLVQLGGAYYHEGNKEKADETYLEAQGYPFFMIDDERYFDRFVNYHVEAIGGLIQVRRGDATALRNIRIGPGFEARFRAELEEAIREAEGDDQRPAVN